MRAPVPAALPADCTLSSGQSGMRPEDHREFHVDMAAEGAGEADAVDMVDAELVHQQPRAGIERGLGQLDGAHIVLRDGDDGLAVAQHVGEGAPVCAGCARDLRASDAVDRRRPG